MLKDLETKYFNCSCMSPEHTIRFVALLDDDIPLNSTLNLEVQLNHYLPWYKRIIPALRFLLGRRKKYNEWDEVLLKREDVTELIKFLKSFEETTDAISSV